MPTYLHFNFTLLFTNQLHAISHLISFCNIQSSNDSIYQPDDAHKQSRSLFLHINLNASVQAACASNMSKSEVICPLAGTVWHRVPELGDLSWGGLVDVASGLDHFCVQSQLQQTHRKFWFSIPFVSQVSELPGNGGKFPAGLSPTNHHFFCSHFSLYHNYTLD